MPSNQVSRIKMSTILKSYWSFHRWWSCQRLKDTCWKMFLHIRKAKWIWNKIRNPKMYNGYVAMSLSKIKGFFKFSRTIKKIKYCDTNWIPTIYEMTDRYILELTFHLYSWSLIPRISKKILHIGSSSSILTD